MSFVDIRNLGLCLGEFSLAGISVFLDRGDYLAVIGPTGSGKTIFLESIVGFRTPESGKIMLDGRDITHALPETRKVGIVYQDYALMPHMTVYGNIAYGLKKHPLSNMDQAIREMAEILHIDHLLHRKPGTLSGGEQQRTAIARALIVKPALLLLDEPFSALDRQTRRITRILLKDLVQNSGTTVIHITHDLDDAWALADKIAVFKSGRMRQSGTMSQVFNRPRSTFVAEFVGTGFYRGRVVSSREGTTVVDLGGTCLASFDPATSGKTADLAIRHENMRLFRSRPAHCNTDNVIRAIVENMAPEGSCSLLDLRVGTGRMNALVPHHTMGRLNLAQGDPVFAVIKKEHVNIVTPLGHTCADSVSAVV